MATILWIENHPSAEVPQVLIEPKDRARIAFMFKRRVNRAALDFNPSGVSGNQIAPALINKFRIPTGVTEHLHH
jgi:hypothetical protein